MALAGSSCSAVAGQWLGLAVGDGQQLRLSTSTCGVPVWPGFPHSMLAVSKGREHRS